MRALSINLKYIYTLYIQPNSIDSEKYHFFDIRKDSIVFGIRNFIIRK